VGWVGCGESYQTGDGEGFIGARKSSSGERRARERSRKSSCPREQPEISESFNGEGEKGVVLFKSFREKEGLELTASIETKSCR